MREIDPYLVAFEAAQEDPFVRSFWGKAMLKQARDLMKSLDAGKAIGNAANGIPISAILSTHLVTPN